jgi:hypothetical protein
VDRFVGQGITHLRVVPWLVLGQAVVRIWIANSSIVSREMSLLGQAVRPLFDRVRQR